MAIPKKALMGFAAAVAIAVAGGYAYVSFWHGERAGAQGIVLYGNVDIREADLAFNVTGRVESMLVEEGEAVKRGQLLATLEADLYGADVDAAKAQTAAQRATLDRLLAGNRPEEIKEARANVQAIEADLDRARADLHRTEKLATNQIAAQQKLDLDRSRVKSLEAQLEASRQRLSLAIQGPRDEVIAEARAQLRAREAEFALALRRLDYTKLFAKDDGVINTRVVEPGAVVQANTPVYIMALTDPVWVRTYVSEPQLGRIQPGMDAEIFTDSTPDRPYAGWIGFISPVAEFTPKTVETAEVRTNLVYRLRVYVRNPDASLRQGMPVTVKLRPQARGQKAANGASK
jgi:membrane fusion protein YbhG